MTFNSHLKEKLKNKRFKKMYEEEKELLDISLKILETRREQNLSQAELANRAHITQQQLSRIENGMNFNTQRPSAKADGLARVG
jgi:HTH-type transcriptional regulator/antitoxin HipB